MNRNRSNTRFIGEPEPSQQNPSLKKKLFSFFKISWKTVYTCELKFKSTKTLRHIASLAQTHKIANMLLYFLLVADLETAETDSPHVYIYTCTTPENFPSIKLNNVFYATTLPQPRAYTVYHQARINTAINPRV